MSTCISRHGEFSSHVTNEDLWCDRCAAWDEAAIERMVEERPLLLAVVQAAEHWLAVDAGVLPSEPFHCAHCDLDSAVRAYRAAATGEAGQ
jgi:hypothetical protein